MDPVTEYEAFGECGYYFHKGESRSAVAVFEGGRLPHPEPVEVCTRCRNALVISGYTATLTKAGFEVIC